MIVVVQRVHDAKCIVDNKIVGQIDKGFLLLVGFGINDNINSLNKIVSKIANLRVFEDENNKMNKSLYDINGSILSISQFTLFADCKKGNRPSFVNALQPSKALELYNKFNNDLRNLNLKVEEGIFGADMTLDFKNDGPVTIILDSEKL